MAVANAGLCAGVVDSLNRWGNSFRFDFEIAEIALGK